VGSFVAVQRGKERSQQLRRAAASQPRNDPQTLGGNLCRQPVSTAITAAAREPGVEEGKLWRQAALLKLD